jgi:UDP-xylose/UDP-N-acetylglucosamine transporter B4
MFCNPGSALTFAQMLFISAHTLPSFLTFQDSSWLPRLKPRQVPLNRWLLQVFLFATSSLLLNWAHGYKVPLTVLILFRSAGL